MCWRKNLRRRLRKQERAGYAQAQGTAPRAYSKGFQTRGKPRRGPEAEKYAKDQEERRKRLQVAPEPPPAAIPLAHGDPVAEAANPSPNLAEAPTAAQDATAPGSGGDILPQVALFERPHETHADARLARRAIMRSWEPEPRATQAILTKAAMMALREDAKLNEVIAVGKLHLDAHGKIMAEEHHNDRMGYYEDALEFRRQTSDAPSMPITVTGSAVSIYIPENFRDNRRDEPDENGPPLENNDRGNLLP